MSIVLASIWLQPWCEGCEKHCSSGEGREWCDHDAWGACEECGKKAMRYLIDRRQLRNRNATE